MAKSRKEIQREYRERNKARIREIRTMVDSDLLETFVDRGMVGCASLIPDWQHVDLVEVTLDQGGLDLVKFRVKWSSHQESAKIPSLIKPNFNASSLKIQEFIFVSWKPNRIIKMFVN